MVTGPACTEVAVKRTVISANAVNARSVCRRLADLVQSGGLGKFILFTTTRVLMARRLQHLGPLIRVGRLSQLDREVSSRRDIKKARMDLRSPLTPALMILRGCCPVSKHRAAGP